MEGQGEGLPKKEGRCVVNALARARRRRFRTCRRCRTCRSAALLVGTERYRRPASVATAAERADTLLVEDGRLLDMDATTAPPPPPPLPNVPNHSLVDDERLV